MRITKSRLLLTINEYLLVLIWGQKSKHENVYKIEAKRPQYGVMLSMTLIYVRMLIIHNHYSPWCPQSIQNELYSSPFLHLIFVFTLY